MYISKDLKSLLIAKPRTHILKNSRYPNQHNSKPDNFYTKANLHMEFICRDIRKLNFICHGENTDYVAFDTEWKPIEMESYIQEIIESETCSVQIKAPVISASDKINLKDTIKLIERKDEENQLKPDIEKLISEDKNFSELLEDPQPNIPMKTCAGRTIRKPDFYKASSSRQS